MGAPLRERRLAGLKAVTQRRQRSTGAAPKRPNLAVSGPLLSNESLEVIVSSSRGGWGKGCENGNPVNDVGILATQLLGLNRDLSVILQMEVVSYQSTSTSARGQEGGICCRGSNVMI